MKKNTLFVPGILMIGYGAIYALLTLFAYMGITQNVLPGQENQETMIMVLSAVIAILAILGGLCGLLKNRLGSMGIGLVFTVAGFVSVVYMQFTQDAFSYFDCLGMLFGIILFSTAKKMDQ